MSDNSGAFGFGKFVPGFDFLQTLAKGASDAMPQLPNISSWVAPTLSVEELDKRIGELKAVHFWLDQNSKALGATIQALEVQKMTLATLKGMNFSMGEVANALKLKTADTVASGMGKVAEAADSMADTAKAVKAKAVGGSKGNGEGGAAPVDPLQWWGALTQQFQQIATNAMQDVTQKTAVDTARAVAGGVAKDVVKAAKKTIAAKARAPARKARAKGKAAPG
ncbi:MAG: hypothetical protein JWQ76_1789 [Ramlibacter sp.]|nr:hypothetical protein [Ramlibacter sp.]